MALFDRGGFYDVDPFGDYIFSQVGRHSPYDFANIDRAARDRAEAAQIAGAQSVGKAGTDSPLAKMADLDLSSDFVPRIPRHLGSRIMDTAEGVLWRPASDVYEQEDNIVIHVDLPGVPKDDITIDTNDINELTIHGEAKTPDEFQCASSRVRERNIGRFRKIVKLPVGYNLSEVTAKYKDGLLEVRIPSGSPAPAKHISIA
ncbi:hypothetical protein RI367_001825 [Sorochytrium milnesiophthora]